MSAFSGGFSDANFPDSGCFSKAVTAEKASDEPRQRDVTGAQCAKRSLLLSTTLHSAELVWLSYFKLFEHG